MRSISNFNGVMAVLAGLSSGAVKRLAKSWELVKHGAQRQYEALQALMSHNGSYKEYRTVLRDVDPPCLPYLGISAISLFLFVDLP